MSADRSSVKDLAGRTWRRRNHAVRALAGCFLLELVSALIFGIQPAVHVIWIANGLLLACLLLVPRGRWRGYFAAGFAGQYAGALIAHSQPWQIGLLLAFLNIAEVALAALLLRRRSGLRPRFTDRHFLMRFLSWAVLAAPATVAVAYSLILHFWVGRPVLPQLTEWFTTDALGMAVATPAFVAIFRTRFRETVPSRASLIYPLLLAILAPVLFTQDSIPAMAILFPLLIMIQLRLGLGWASLSTLFLAAMGSFLAYGSHLGVTASGPIGPVESGLRLQLMIAAAMFMLYAISMVVDNLRITERKLRQTVFLHNLVTENSRDVIIIADLKGDRSYVSAAASSLGGWTREELLHLNSLDLLHPGDRPRAAELVKQLYQGQDWAMLECRVRKQDGEYLWVESSLRAIRDPATGRATGILNMVREISERKRAEQIREFNQSVLSGIHEGSLDGILVVNDKGRVVWFNRKFAEVWRINPPEVPRNQLTPTHEVQDSAFLSQGIAKAKDPEAFLRRVQELYADHEAEDQCEVELADGRTLERYTTPLRAEDGRYLGRVWFVRDVTERIDAERRLKAAYEEVEKLAVVDALTGIANRRRFDEYLGLEWRRAIRDQRSVSIILLDVDMFKLYNDTYGHLRGDDCLREVAETAAEVVTRAGDLPARFGGEEFAVVLPNTNEGGALAIASQIRDAVRDRVIRHEKSPYGVVTISAGCAAMVPPPGLDATQLIESADTALYQAKRNGRNRVCSSADVDSQTKGPHQINLA